MTLNLNMCTVHKGVELILVFDHVKGATYRYCPLCNPQPPVRGSM